MNLARSSTLAVALATMVPIACWGSTPHSTHSVFDEPEPPAAISLIAKSCADPLIALQTDYELQFVYNYPDPAFMRTSGGQTLFVPIASDAKPRRTAEGYTLTCKGRIGKLVNGHQGGRKKVSVTWHADGAGMLKSFSVSFWLGMFHHVRGETWSVPSPRAEWISYKNWKLEQAAAIANAAPETQRPGDARGYAECRSKPMVNAIASLVAKTYDVALGQVRIGDSVRSFGPRTFNYSMNNDSGDARSVLMCTYAIQIPGHYTTEYQATLMANGDLQLQSSQSRYDSMMDTPTSNDFRDGYDGGDYGSPGDDGGSSGSPLTPMTSCEMDNGCGN